MKTNKSSAFDCNVVKAAAIIAVTGCVMTGILGSWLPGLATIAAFGMLQFFKYNRKKPLTK